MENKTNSTRSLFDHLLFVTLVPNPAAANPAPAPNETASAVAAPTARKSASTAAVVYPYAPKVKEQLAPTPTSDGDTPSVAYPPSAPIFCFPDIELVSRATKDRLGISIGDCYVFVLTDSEGTRQYGFCRRMMIKEKKKNALRLFAKEEDPPPTEEKQPPTLPSCLCIITHQLTTSPSPSFLNAHVNVC